MMNWRELWVILVGDQPSTEYFSPVAAAVLVYITIGIIGYILYSFTHILPGFLRLYFQTFIKTMIFCAFGFGHKIMWRYFGGIGYLSTMIPILTISNHLFKYGYASPLSIWADLMERKSSLLQFLVLTTIQIISGISAFRLGRFVYQLDFHPMLSEDLQNEFCETDLKVSVSTGVLIELVGSGFDAWVWMQPISKNSIIDTTVKLANMGLIVILGIHYTGMYIQPALATGMTFGCKGATAFEHVLAYWIGPFVGVYIAIITNRYLNLNGKENTDHSGSRKEKDKSGINNNFGKNEVRKRTSRQRKE